MALIIPLLFLSSISTYAGLLPDNWSYSIDENEDINLVKKEWSWVDQLKSYFIDSIIPITKSVLVVISLLYLIILIFWLSISWWEEDIISNFKIRVWYLALGLLIISISEPLSIAFDPIDNYDQFWDKEKFAAIAYLIIDRFTILSWWIAVLMMTISWIRLIVSKWEETIIEEQKRSFTYSFIWIIIILIFNRVVVDILYLNYWLGSPNEEAAIWASQEILWVVAWATQYLALWAMWVFILAWVYYVFSIWEDESTKTAKAIMKNAIIWIIVVLISYTIISTFIPH